MAPSKIWTIGFDARLAGPRHAGIGRYSEELLKRLLRLSASNTQHTVRWEVFVTPDHELSWLPRWEKEGHIQVIKSNVRHYSFAEQTRWWYELQQRHLDLLHVPHFNVPILYTQPFIVTIHDLLWHQERDARATTLPAPVHWVKHRAYEFVSSQAIRRAKALFVPTKWVAKDVQRVTGRSKQVIVTPEGIAKNFVKAEFVASRKKQSPYIVYTGSLYPHKNISVVLRALRQLPNMKLKIVGARSVFGERTRSQAERMGVAHQIEWCGYVADSEVVELYQQAVALIQPSRAEGFGLTGLEALATGCPIIVSDITVFHEVYQEHANYFPSYDAVTLAHVIERLTVSPPSTAERKRGQLFARGYTWDRTAELTWQGYQSVLDRLADTQLATQV